MDYKEFEDKVMETLQERLGDGYRVEKDSPGNLCGEAGRRILIGRQGVNASMIDRMDEYHRGNGFTEEKVSAAADRIVEACKGNLPDCDINVSAFADWDKIKPHIYAKLVNAERNKERLRNIPHREYLDLSLVYYARMEEIFPGRHATVPVWNAHLQIWGVDEETLYRTAMENMQDADEAAFESMGELLGAFLKAKLKDREDMEKDCPLFVLGNKSRVNGAVQICSREMMERVAGFFKDDFWILPSSVHEVIVFPAGRFGENAEGLAGMVKEVNDTAVAPEEILSYHVYRYIRLTGETIIAA